MIIPISEIQSVLRSLAEQQDHRAEPASGIHLSLDQRTIEVLGAAASLVDSLALSQAQRGQTERGGLPWTALEDERLKTMFVARPPLAAMATSHGRTAVAIRSRLVKLGLLGNTESYA